MSLCGSAWASAVVMSFQVGFVSWAHIIAATLPRAVSLSRGLCLSLTLCASHPLEAEQLFG